MVVRAPGMPVARSDVEAEPAIELGCGIEVAHGVAERTRLPPLDENDLDRLRDRLDVQHRIAQPIDAADHVLVEPHLLEHGAARAVHELPVDDVPERLGVYDHAYVVRADIAHE